jgi:hypothetical protein
MVDQADVPPNDEKYKKNVVWGDAATDVTTRLAATTGPMSTSDKNQRDHTLWYVTQNLGFSAAASNHQYHH